MAAERASHPLWSFSLRVYAQDGVAADCLRLQDEGGADVNLVLMALWLAADRGIALTPADAEAVVAATAEWRDDIVRPLRGIRRISKTAGLIDGVARDSFRAKLKAVELEAERLEQDFLYRWCSARWRADGTKPNPALGYSNVDALLAAECGSAFAKAMRNISHSLAERAAAALPEAHSQDS